MSSTLPERISMSELWHHRLNQVAHRVSSLGWLLLAGVAFPAKLPASIMGSLAIIAAIIASVCAMAAILPVRRVDGDWREAVGALVFSILLAGTSCLVAAWLHLEIRPTLAAWLRIEPNPRWLPWCVGGVAVALVVWIVAAVALCRGRQ